MSADKGQQKVSLARRDMPGLRAILDRRSDFSDFAGTNLLGCVTVTPETGVLVLTLVELGANVRWCSDNRFASDDDVVDHLSAQGIPVFARANMTTDEHFASMALRERPGGALPVRTAITTAGREREMLVAAAEAAHACADPGLLFAARMNEGNPTPRSASTCPQSVCRSRHRIV